MKEHTVGFRFVARVNGSDTFIVKSLQIYLYGIAEKDIQRIAGRLIKVDGYSNPLIPIGIFDEQPRKSISSDKIKIISAQESRMNFEDASTKETCDLASEFYSEIKTLLGVQTMSCDSTPLEDTFTKAINYNKKENTTMNMTMPNMTFGPYNNSRVSLSFYGLAVQNVTTKRWFSYKNGESYDVTDFLMQGMPNMIFAMPMSIKKIAVSDIILHNNAPMVVQSIIEGRISAVDVSTSEVKEIMPAKSPFGFNFCTKLISMFDGEMFGGDGEDDFFGDNPMMMMAMCGGFNNADSTGENPMNNMMTMMMMGKMMKSFTD